MHPIYLTPSDQNQVKVSDTQDKFLVIDDEEKKVR